MFEPYQTKRRRVKMHAVWTDYKICGRGCFDPECLSIFGHIKSIELAFEHFTIS